MIVVVLSLAEKGGAPVKKQGELLCDGALSVSFATEEDVRAVACMEAEVFSDPWQAQDIERHLTAEHLFLLVARMDGALCGYLLGSVIAPEGEIYRVASATSARRLGVGAALCRAFLSLCDCCYLEVRRSNVPARALYEVLGFTLMGERKNYYKNPTEDACLYRR